MYSKRYWPDSTISNKHLRIHCIIYEKHGNGEISPLVYATDVSGNGTILKKKVAACSGLQDERSVLMTRKSGAFLLDEQDELRMSDFVTLIYHATDPYEELRLTGVQEREKGQFASRYFITGRQIGKGGFGKVVVGIHQKSNRQLACKIIDLRELYHQHPTPDLQQQVSGEAQRSTSTQHKKRWSSYVLRSSREFKILKDLSHPNIVQVEKVMWSPSTIYIFSELVTGGDLFSYIERKGEALPSIDAAVILMQVLKAVDYMHDHDIVHRDIKPDNILLTYPEVGARIVLTDFGNARVLPKATHANSQRRMFSNTGTLEYVAPEVHSMNKTVPAAAGYTPAVDMWSIGVVAATLLSGLSIFEASPNELDPVNAIMALQAACDLSIIDDPTHYAWSKVRHEPKDFLRRLLVLDVNDRMTAKQALAHPWFNNKHLADEFEALYQRSIRDWQPRLKVEKFIEPICVTTANDVPTPPTHSHYFQQPSDQASFRDIQDRFSGSQDWDLTVVYPPSEGDSSVAEHEEAQFDGPSRYDQHSFELGLPSGNAYLRDPVGDSMNQLSLDQGLWLPSNPIYDIRPSLANTVIPPDPPASGMYDEQSDHREERQSDEVFAQPHQTPEEVPGNANVHTSYHDTFTESPIPLPPTTQAASNYTAVQRTPTPELETSVVYETPLRYSQLQDLPCYEDIFGQVQHEASDNDQIGASKKRKFTQTCF